MQPAPKPHSDVLLLRLQTLQSQVIPTLVRLLGDPAVRFSVPRCLNSIIEGNEALQKVATDFEAIPKLAALLQTATAHTALLVRTQQQENSAEQDVYSSACCVIYMTFQTRLTARHLVLTSRWW